METSLKRIIAYLIDSIIVMAFVTLLVNIKAINPYVDEYNKYVEENHELLEHQDEYTDKELSNKAIEINYNMNKNSVISSPIIVVSIILYFTVVPTLMKGQTVGKKILKLRTVHKDEDKKLKFGHYLIRIVILYGIIFRILSLVGVFIFGANGYYYYSAVVSLVQEIVEITILLMVVIRKDHRGLHDFLAKTKVIDLKEEVNG